MSGSGTRIWWQNFGQDGMFWNLPFQTTAQWITSGSLANILRQGSGHVHLPGDFCIPFVVGQATDPLVTIIDSSGNLPNFQLHIPLGTVQEQPITGTDNGLGVADVTKPYALYTLNSVTMNTSSVQASGTVITCHNALAIDDACGPIMMDAITGQPGTGNAFGAIQDAELTAARADPNYVIQHMLAYEMDPSQMNSAAAIWPLKIIDTSFPNTGGMNQGYTIGIPANVPRPTGMSRGKALLWDVFQQFGAFFYNVSGNGTISIDCFWSSAANQSLANDVANSFASIVPQLSILSNQTGLSSMKGMVNGIRSDAFPAPPILSLSPTGGLEVAPSTMGAFHPSGYNVVPSAVLSAPALTINTPSQQNANASFAVTGGISGYSTAPTLNYVDDATSQSAPNPLVIMPLGDSVTAGGGTAVNGGPPPGSYRGYLYQSLTADGYNVNYVGDQTVNPGGGLPSNQDNHEGLGGFGIITVQGDQANPGILDYLQANNTLTTYRPNLILLMAGFNNLFVAAPANLGPTATYAAMQQLCTYIVQTLPTCKLMVSAEVGAADVPGNDTSNELGQLNALIPGLAAISPNITVINGCSLFNYDGSDTGPDGLHPNVAGCQAIAAAYEIGIKALYPSSGTGGTFIPLPTGNSVTSTAFSFTNPGLVAGTHHVTVRDANNTSVVVATGAFNVVAGAAAVILPAKPSLPVSGLPFTVSGTLTGYGAAPTLTYSDNSGVATAFPSGSTVTASTFTFLHPGLASGNYNTLISDGSVSGGASYTVTTVSGGVSASPSTILAGATTGLNDASGNRWSITSGGQVAVNGVVDTTTSGVTEMAWVSPLMWHLNTSGLWFSKSSPTAAWTPAAGTTTSPLVTTPTVGINPITGPAPNTPFVISGPLANYATAPALTYSDNAGAAVALPSGSTVTTSAFSFTHPGMAAGTDTVTVSDGTHSASATYSVSTAGWTNLAATPNLSNTVPGLAASTSYDIEVYATNSVGQGPPSAILTVVTGVAGTVAPGIPTGLTSTSLAQTTVNLAWAAPALGTPPITYATRYSLDAVTAGVTATRAFNFTDSIGVNGHFGQSPYAGNSPMVIASLQFIGVTHVRDYMDTSANYTNLYAAGIKFDYLFDWSGNEITTQFPNYDIPTITTLVNAHPGILEMLEGPNEINAPGSVTFNGNPSSTPSVSVQIEQYLYTNAKATPVMANIPFASITFSDGFPDATWQAYVTGLGNLSAYADRGSAHIYCGDNQPRPFIVARIPWILDYVPGKPIFTTESGWSTSPADPAGQGVNQATQAKNTLNMLFDMYQLLGPFSRTYIYELLDDIATPATTDYEDNFGLFLSTGTAKQAATALHNMHAILNDTGATASSFIPGKINYSLTNLPALGFSLTLQKSDGSFVICVWNEPVNFNNGAAVTVTPVTVTVSFGATFGTVAVYAPFLSATAQSTTTNAASVNISLADHPVLIQVASPTNSPVWIAGPSVSGTSAQITGLTGGTTYDFEVSASNAAGTSAFSAPYTVATTFTAPTAVTWGTNAGSMTLSNGNLTATAGGSTTAYASHSAVLSTTSLSTGKASFEVTMPGITQNSAIGLATATYPLADGLGADTMSLGYYMSTGVGSQVAQTIYINNNPVLTPSGNSPPADTAGAVFTFCVDLDANLFWVTSPAIIAAYGANAWNDSATANPATGVGGISFASLTGGAALSIAASTDEGGAVFVLNAGSSTFTRAARIPSTFPAWSGTTVAAVAPGTVTGLVAGTPSNVSVPLTWTAPTTGSLPLTYNVLVSPHGANTFTLATTSPTTSASVTGLTANTAYDFEVFATNSAGTGGTSSLVTATTLTQAVVPGAPVGLSAGTATTTSVPLTWTPPTSGGAPTGYQVQFKLATASTWTNFTPTVVA